MRQRQRRQGFFVNGGIGRGNQRMRPGKGSTDKNKRQLRADLMLVLVTFFWGSSYYMMDLSLEEVDPFNLNAYRFLGSFLIAALVFHKRLKNISANTLKGSLIVGLSLFFVYIGATFGVKMTSLSKSAFLCDLTVIIVPILEFFVLKKKADRKTLFAVLLCLAGIMLMTLNSDLSLNMDELAGNLLCIMCAFFYAVDLLVTDKFVKKDDVDAFQLGVLELGFTGIFMLISTFVFEDIRVPSSPAVWGSVIFLTVFCTGAAFIIQSVAQKDTVPAHVGIIFTLEPVFAAIVAAVFAHDFMTLREYVGAALMVVSILVIEIGSGKEDAGGAPAEYAGEAGAAPGENAESAGAAQENSADEGSAGGAQENSADEESAGGAPESPAEENEH